MSFMNKMSDCAYWFVCHVLQHDAREKLTYRHRRVDGDLWRVHFFLDQNELNVL